MPQRPSVLAQTISVTVLLTLSSVACADDDNDQARYRHVVMEAIGNSFGALALVFTNRVERPDELAVHARALAESASLIPGLFPEGSEGGDALPTIWREPGKVNQAAEETVRTTAELAAAAESGDRAAIAKAFKAAGDSCKSCHERYKEADD